MAFGSNCWVAWFAHGIWLNNCCCCTGLWLLLECWLFICIVRSCQSWWCWSIGWKRCCCWYRWFCCCWCWLNLKRDWFGSWRWNSLKESGSVDATLLLGRYPFAVWRLPGFMDDAQILPKKHKWLGQKNTRNKEKKKEKKRYCGYERTVWLGYENKEQSFSKLDFKICHCLWASSFKLRSCDITSVYWHQITCHYPRIRNIHCRDGSVLPIARVVESFTFSCPFHTHIHIMSLRRLSQLRALHVKGFHSSANLKALNALALPKAEQISANWKGTSATGESTKNFIGGEFIESQSTEWIDVHDPVMLCSSIPASLSSNLQGLPHRHPKRSWLAFLKQRNLNSRRRSMLHRKHISRGVGQVS